LLHLNHVVQTFLNRWSDPCSQSSLTFIGASKAAASHIVVLLWAYYSAQIFRFGAEFTWVYGQRYGSRRTLPPR